MGQMVRRGLGERAKGRQLVGVLLLEKFASDDAADRLCVVALLSFDRREEVLDLCVRAATRRPQALNWP